MTVHIDTNYIVFFFFNDTATTEIYTLSLHDALPILFGPDKVTTGAYSDIQQATEMARRMVTQFGMSDVVGPIAVGDREAEIFLGREVVQRRGGSERTAGLVGTELKRLLGDRKSTRLNSSH